MSMSDPVADMLTRIRNAAGAGHRKVDIPGSRMKTEIARIMKSKGFIHNYACVEDNRQGYIRLYLRYSSDDESAIQGLERISRPGLRRYVSVGEIPRVLNGLGVAILSTPRGILTGSEARTAGVGGEVLCHLW
ncbi:MAG: 30S ribosomal protein S8 [Candidatus Latescibacteria bacterium]|nr:30S ribosomal protein S8 [Candidatus Latescibacterota bacterium]